MIPVKVLAVRYLSAVSRSLSQALGTNEPCLGLITTDSDDPTYIALDQATKDAQVTVCYGRSFYAGAGNSTTPYAGEVVGILAGPTPGAVRSGMEAALSALERVGFDEVNGVPYLAHTVSSAGSYLSGEAGVRQGSALAYLIAPPLESMYALDAAMKAADVKLCKLYAPPSETNFGGGLLTGTRSACVAACDAFAAAVAEVAQSPR
jgi:ethanolamine utilization protein EutL